MITENVLLGDNSDRYFISSDDDIYLFESNKKLTINFKNNTHDNEYSWSINKKGSLIVKSNNETFFLKFRSFDNDVLFLDKYEKVESEYIKVEEIKLNSYKNDSLIDNEQKLKLDIEASLDNLDKKDRINLSVIFLILLSLIHILLNFLIFIKDLHQVIIFLFAAFICMNVKEYIIFLYLKLKTKDK